MQGGACAWLARGLQAALAVLPAVWLGQQKLPFAFDVRLNQIPEHWHQVAVRFRRANGIRDGDREQSDW